VNYYILALILLGYMTFWFVISVVKKRNDVADIAWGLGFVLMAWASFFISGISFKEMTCEICLNISETQSHYL